MSSKLKVGVVGCGIGQLLYYMGWVDANLSRTGKSRGIIVAKIKGKVKSDYLLKAVLDAITADSATDYYAPFSLGYCW